MNKDDIDKIVGEVTGYGYSISNCGSLIYNNAASWLATESSNTSLWVVSDGGTIYNSLHAYTRNNSYGIRAKVTLVEGGRRTVSL